VNYLEPYGFQLRLQLVERETRMETKTFPTNTVILIQEAATA
jgi:hypothetical protein